MMCSAQAQPNKMLLKALLSAAVAVGTVTAQGTGEWTETFVRYFGEGPIRDTRGPYDGDNPDRWHLNYALPASGRAPFPVVFFAHGNNGNVNLPEGQIRTITEQGYAVVSWESITAISPSNPLEAFTCWADFDRVLDWARTSAPAELSAENWIVAGRSRGSVCSWAAAHSGIGEVQGMYMYNALPLPDISLFEVMITRDSPPGSFNWGPECPVPIIISGPDQCTMRDIHNPVSGQKIVNRYNDLGLGREVWFRQGMHREGTSSNIWTYFPDFLRELDNSNNNNRGNATNLTEIS